MLEVNSINGNQNQYISNPTKVEKAVVNHSRPIYPNDPMTGLNTLGVYNAAMIVKEFPADKEPLSLIYNPKDGLDTIKGEYIKSSDGKLVGIKTQDDKTETYYTVENDEVKTVSVKDKATGKELKRQQYVDFYSEKTIEVIENSLVDDSLHKTTWYENGIAQEINTSKDLPGDKFAGITYFTDTKNKEYYLTAPEGFTNMDVNDKGQITRISSNIEKDGKGIRRIMNLYNGVVVSESVEKTQTLPNMAGLELANLPELQPCKKYIINENAKSSNGDKTYYSNGVIEKNTLPNSISYYYNPNGDIQKIIDGNKTITYEGKAQKIEEDLGNSKIKITTFYNDGYSVLLKDTGKYKSVMYHNNKISQYEEGTINSEGKELHTKNLFFDRNGMLESEYNYGPVSS